MTFPNREATTIYSTLAADPDLCELVESFVAELPNRIASMETAFSDEDWPILCQIAHQLKGACGSYGFSEMTPFALALENASREGCDKERIETTLKEFVAVCGRASTEAPQLTG